MLDRVEVIALLLMLCLHLEVFQGLVELFVLCSLLFLLERLDLRLLPEETALNFGHMLICLEHLSEEVIGARDRHLRLNQE